MSKLLKIGIPVLVILGLGYGVGYYYANKIAKEEANKAITAIKNKSPEIQNITYASVNAGFFSLFDHSVSINNVDIQLKSMPKNPIHINLVGIENIQIDQNKAPKSFEISYSGLSLSNANQFVQQYFKNANILTNAYPQLASTNMAVQAQNQQAINNYIQSVADQYANAKLSGDIHYKQKNKTLSIHATISVAGEVAYTFNSLFTNYEIHNNPHGFINAFNQAKIAEFDYQLHLSKFGNKNIISKAFPDYKSVVDSANPNFDLQVKYLGKTKDLSFKANLINQTKLHNGQDNNLLVHSDVLLHNITLSKYTLQQLTHGDYTKAFEKAYFGKSDSQFHIASVITQKEIEVLPPQYQALVKKAFGKQKIEIFFDAKDNIDFDQKGKGSDVMRFGLRGMGDIKTYFDYQYTSKLYLKEVIDYIQTYMTDLKQDQDNTSDVMNQNLSQEIKLADKVAVNKAGLIINNQTLIQDLIKLYSGMSGQKPQQITKMFQQQLTALAMQSQTKFAKDFFNSLAEYLSKPEKYELSFIPKGKVTWGEVLQNYANANDQLSTAQEQQNNEQNTPDQLSVMQTAYEKTLKLFHYQFKVNNQNFN